MGVALCLAHPSPSLCRWYTVCLVSSSRMWSSGGTLPPEKMEGVYRVAAKLVTVMQGAHQDEGPSAAAARTALQQLKGFKLLDIHDYGKGSKDDSSLNAGSASGSPRILILECAARPGSVGDKLLQAGAYPVRYWENNLYSKVYKNMLLYDA